MGSGPLRHSQEQSESRLFWLANDNRPPTSPHGKSGAGPLQRDCSVRFKPQNCDVCPLCVRAWRAPLRCQEVVDFCSQKRL
jgi:hypothetical protein